VSALYDRHKHAQQCRMNLGSVLAMVVGLCLVSASGCASVPDADSRLTMIDGPTGTILQPDYVFYRDNLDQYLNRRCGTLDCHGQAGRAYRSYGTRGLRLFDPDARLVPGGQNTTEKERKLNYQSIVALEPEELRRVVAEPSRSPNTWIFLRKPLRLERHKGAEAMRESDDGYLCIAGWAKMRMQTPVDGGAPSADAGADPKLDALRAACKRAAEQF
jgi:hypothetical protein